MVVDLDSCPQTINESFAINEGSKIYRFAAPSDDVQFDGCDSDFDTVFTIYTEAQYLSGYESDYEARNDDAFSVCGDSDYASYVNLPYDSNYDGDYYLVVRPYEYSMDTESELVIEFVCGAGEDTDDWPWDMDTNSPTPRPTYVQ